MVEISLKNRNLRITSRRVRIGFIYLILIAGGLWHVLNVFEQTMEILAAPVIMGIGAWLFLEYNYRISGRDKIAFATWGGGVLFLSILIEWIGVKTGWLFGHYSYGEVLEPQINGVPIAIGFAWLAMLISSVAFVQRLITPENKTKIMFASLLTALLMVSFDVFLEPAAMKLEYWYWLQGYVPFSNYVTWFVASFIFAYAGFKYQVFNHEIPSIAMHAYIAQLIYFVTVNIAVV